MDRLPPPIWALLAIAMGVAIVAALVGNWWTVAGMVLLLLAQALNLRHRSTRDRR